MLCVHSILSRASATPQLVSSMCMMVVCFCSPIKDWDYHNKHFHESYAEEKFVPTALNLYEVLCKAHTRNLLPNLNPNSTLKVVDLGCGPGSGLIAVEVKACVHLVPFYFPAHTKALCKLWYASFLFTFRACPCRRLGRSCISSQWSIRLWTMLIGLCN